MTKSSFGLTNGCLQKIFLSMNIEILEITSTSRARQKITKVAGGIKMRMCGENAPKCMPLVFENAAIFFYSKRSKNFFAGLAKALA